MERQMVATFSCLFTTTTNMQTMEMWMACNGKVEERKENKKGV